MFKVRWQSTLLAVAIAIAVLPNASFLNAQAQSDSRMEPLSWSGILAGMRRKPPLGGRGDVCPIAPLATTSNAEKEIPQIWSDRPLFIWQGYRAIGLRLANTKSMETKSPLWRGEGTNNKGSATRHLQYQGQPLQSGQAYEWLFFFDRNTEDPIGQLQFQVMDETTRSAIAADLAKLDQQLKAAKANPEEIALQRANYFAQKKLWADVLQEVYSVNNPSAELQQIAKEIETSTCQSKK